MEIPVSANRRDTITTLRPGEERVFDLSSLVSRLFVKCECMKLAEAVFHVEGQPTANLEGYWTIREPDFRNASVSTEINPNHYEDSGKPKPNF